MITSIDYKGPNSFESKMNIFRFIFRRFKGMSYRNSKLINISNNKVQEEIDNVSANMNLSELNNLYTDGYRIDINKYHNLYNDKLHIITDKLFLKKD